MQSQERVRIAAFLEGEVAGGASSDGVAATVASILRSIDQALAPIVGQRGMAALYKRSVHLSRQIHPWLSIAAEGADASMDIEALAAALATRTSVDAAAVGTELLASLRGLLSTLIGESLTERLLRPVWATLLTDRLLRPVWATLLSGPSARDTNS